MKAIKKWRYYCDFCKKAGCNKHAIVVHEKHCTNNPNRVCGMCHSKPDIPALIAALGTGDDSGVLRLREEAEDCPICMLSAIRQSKLQHGYEDEETPGFFVKFDFAAEKKAWWDNNTPGYF